MIDPRPRNDEGVSNVIGAIMMFSLLVITLVTIQSAFVPVWEAEREAAHADLVGNQIGFLKAELDRQTVGGSVAPVTGHFDLRTEGGFSFFRQAGLNGEARFIPGSGTMTFGAPSITLQSSGGTSLLGVQETWETIVDGVEVGPIDSLLHLRVRVPNPHALSAGITSTLTLHDANDAYAGKIVLRNGEDAMYVSTYSANSATEPITNRLDDTDPDGPTFYFNLLDTNLLFDSVIAAAEKPVTMILDEAGLPADYTVVYDRNTPTGIERVGADIGILVLDYNFTAPSGVLSIDARHQNFIDQKYVLEHGAILLVQPDGAAMVAPPSFTATKGPSQDRIRWTIPTLAGTPASVSTAQAVATVSATGGGVGLSAVMPSFSLTLPTEYPALWADFWTRTLRDAGFDEPGGEFTTVLTADTATLTVYGPVPAPASTTNDIVLDLQQAIVTVRLAPFG